MGEGRELVLHRIIVLHVTGLREETGENPNTRGDHIQTPLTCPGLTTVLPPGSPRLKCLHYNLVALFLFMLYFCIASSIVNVMFFFFYNLWLLYKIISLKQLYLISSYLILIETCTTFCNLLAFCVNLFAAPAFPGQALPNGYPGCPIRGNPSQPVRADNRPHSLVGLQDKVRLTCLPFVSPLHSYVHLQNPKHPL